MACLGGMYEKLGRMVGRSYEETISLLIKGLKNAEVNTSKSRILLFITIILKLLLKLCATECYHTFLDVTV